MYTNIQQAVASVQNAFPSIYTKDDVVKLLESIEIDSSGKGTFTREQISVLVERLIEEVKSNVSRLDSDCIDRGSAEFSLNYNEVELDSVDFDTSEVSDNIVYGLVDVVDTFFDEYDLGGEEKEGVLIEEEIV